MEIRLKVYSAIASVMSDLCRVGIGKERSNQQQGFKYRGIDDVFNALAPLLSKHNLVILPRVLERDVTERQSAQGKALFYTVLKVEFDFVSAEDGSKHTVCTVGEAMDSGDKSSNKSMSAAYKYACFQAFCIPTEADNDPDAHAHEVAPPKWDGRVQVGFSKNYKDALWRDIPQDFLEWCNDPKNKLGQQYKEFAALEKKRRTEESANYLKEMPESFREGARQ